MALLHGLMDPKGEVNKGTSASAGAFTGSYPPEQALQAEGPALQMDAPAEAPQSEGLPAQPVKLREKRLPVNEFRVRCKCGCCYHGYYRNKTVTLNFLTEEDAFEEKLEAIEQEARRKDRIALENRNAANARRRRLS